MQVIFFDKIYGADRKKPVESSKQPKVTVSNDYCLEQEPDTDSASCSGPG